MVTGWDLRSVSLTRGAATEASSFREIAVNSGLFKTKPSSYRDVKRLWFQLVAGHFPTEY